MTELSTEQRARIDAARAKKAESSLQREALEAKAAAEAEVFAAEREAADEAAIAAAIAEHGPIGTHIGLVETRLGVVIVKRANHLVYRKFQDKEKDDAAFTRLVRHALVYPDIAAFEKINEELPTTAVHAANVVCELAGVRSKETLGK